MADAAHNETRNHQGYANEVAAASMGERLWLLVRCEGAFVDENNGTILALFTLAIAAFTLTLKRSTDKLWEAGEKQIAVAQRAADAAVASADVAKRSLNDLERAYCFIGPAEVRTVQHANGTRTATVVLDISNKGRTPAIVQEFFAEFFDSLTVPLATPIYSEERGKRFHADFVLGDRETQKLEKIPQISTILDPHLMFGYVRYLDIFRNQHTSRFCVIIDAMRANFEVAGPAAWNDWD